MNLTFILCVFHFTVANGQPTHKQVRQDFPKVVNDEHACIEFIDNLKDIPEKDFILVAYRGGANIVMAKYVSSPNKKLQYFSQGKEELDRSVKKMPKNVELRFLRFTIQQNTPSMLFYDDQDEDLPFILSHIQEVGDPDFKIRIKEFLINSGKLSEEQITQLKRT